ncbi:MAG: hypothetical protein K9L98_02190 [Candidatus Pacebacteria bacterium]|nr:hypothetical protein [Candidatus Paceibacterota bacterium]MCF7862796.1 hypothetical protein [Candidatus Paceibacterota bacterium]
MKKTPEQALEEIFDEYKDQGLISLYLYGSILTKDYIEGASDIDSIGFATEEMSITLENEIKNKLCEKTGFEQFGFRLLYKSELDTGVIKGNLASFIHPQLLLLDFPHWKYVIGKNFLRSDFLLVDIDAIGAVKIRLDHLVRIENESFKTHPGGKHILFLKVLARIMFHLQKERGCNDPFSYSSVFSNSNEEEKPVAEAILNCKKSKWDESMFKENVTIYKNYIDTLRSRYL